MAFIDSTRASRTRPRASRTKLSSLRRALWAPSIGVLGAAALLACGDVTVILEAPAAEDAPPIEDPCADLPEPADPTPFEVRDPASGVFIGNTLHLDATVSGERRYVVLEIASIEVAHAVAIRDDLLGPANWAPVAEGTHARVRAGSAGDVHVDVLDTTNPTAPALLASKAIAADVDASLPLVFSADREHVFFCAREAPEEQRKLVAVHLYDPTQPGDPSWLGTPMCDHYPDGGMAAQGEIWMVWGKEYDLDVYTVDPQGWTHIADYYYNPDGVHAYGEVLHASTDGSRAVFDPANDSEFFLVNVPEYTPSGAIAHAYFGIAGPKRLLGVTGQVAYLATPDGIRAYEISDIDQPKLLSYEAHINFGEGLARLIATSDRWLAVVDASGALYVVPSHVSGRVEPLRVYGAEGPPAPAPSCNGQR
jgi:hypothetical protein